MSAKKLSLSFLIVSLVFLPAMSFAAEHGGSTTAPSGMDKKDTSTSTPAAPKSAAPNAAPETVPAPVVPEAAPEPAPVMPPALKPISITFGGSLSVISMTDTPPKITVQDRYGVKKEISVPAEAKVSIGGASKALSDLKVGDNLTVEYTYDVASGGRTAQSISIGEAAAPAGK